MKFLSEWDGGERERGREKGSATVSASFGIYIGVSLKLVHRVTLFSY